MRSLVVGSGITGLTIARCLKQLGYNVSLVDKSSELFTADYPISLYPNAQQVLSSIYNKEKWMSLTTPSKPAGYRSTKGDWLFYPTKQAELSNAIISQRKLKNLLLTEPTPLDVIYNYNVVKIEGYGNPGRVNTHFKVEDKPITTISEEGQILEADFVIAADGQHSNCRSIVYPSTRRNIFEYSGLCRFGGVVPYKTLPFDPSHTLCAKFQTFSLYYMNEEEVGWLATVPIPFSNLPISTPKSKQIISVKQNLHIFDTFKFAHKYIKDIINKLEENDSQCYIEPIFEDDMTCFSHARVGFVGSSAYAHSPYFLDENTSIAIEDCGQIMSHLAQIIGHTPPLTILNQTSKITHSTHPTIQRFFDLYNSSRKARTEELIINSQFLRTLISKHYPFLHNLIRYTPNLITNNFYQKVLKANL